MVFKLTTNLYRLFYFDGITIKCLRNSNYQNSQEIFVYNENCQNFPFR